MDNLDDSIFYWNITKKIFFGSIMGFISLTAILGNIFVIIAMIREEKLRTVCFYFILFCYKNLNFNLNYFNFILRFQICTFLVFQYLIF